MTTMQPLRILMSPEAARRTAQGLAALLGGKPYVLARIGEDADVAFTKATSASSPMRAST